MVYAFISLVVIFCALVFSELLWRTNRLKPEMARKAVHIVAGGVVATWPFYLSNPAIIGLATLMMVVVFASYKLNVFTSIHSVKRKTYGEMFFALGIIAAALITDSPWIFAAAVLHVSFADGLAGIIGTHVKKPKKYIVFKHFKTVQGTLAFFVISMSIFAAAIYFDPLTIPDITLPIIALFSLTIALIENVSLYGSDDIIVPIVVAGLLEFLAFVT